MSGLHQTSARQICRFFLGIVIGSGIFSATIPSFVFSAEQDPVVQQSLETIQRNERFRKAIQLVELYSPLKITREVNERRINIVSFLETPAFCENYDDEFKKREDELIQTQFFVQDRIGDRNVVVVQDVTGPKIIVTGIGPRYGNVDKAKLEDIFEKVEVLDIVDLLPLSQPLSSEEKKICRRKLRSFLFLTDLLDQRMDAFFNKEQLGKISNQMKTGKGNFKNILTQMTNITKYKEDFDLVVSDSTCDYGRWKDDLDFMKSVIDQKFDSQHVYENMKHLCEDLQEIKKFINENAPKYLETLIAGMIQILKKLKPYENKDAYNFVKGELKSVLKGNPLEKIRNIVSFGKKKAKVSHSGLPLPNDSEDWFGHLFHSEPLAAYWMMNHSNFESIKPFFYTQRDMCEVCSVFMIKFLLFYDKTRNLLKKGSFSIFSGKEAQTPQRNSEIAAGWTSTLSSPLWETIGYRPVLSECHESTFNKLLKDLGICRIRLVANDPTVQSNNEASQEKENQKKSGGVSFEEKFIEAFESLKNSPWMEPNWRSELFDAFASFKKVGMVHWIFESQENLSKALENLKYKKMFDVHPSPAQKRRKAEAAKKQRRAVDSLLKRITSQTIKRANSAPMKSSSPKISSDSGNSFSLAVQSLP